MALVCPPMVMGNKGEEIKTFRLGDDVEIKLISFSSVASAAVTTDNDSAVDLFQQQYDDEKKQQQHNDDSQEITTSSRISAVEESDQHCFGLDLTNFTGRLQVRKIVETSNNGGGFSASSSPMAGGSLIATITRTSKEPAQQQQQVIPGGPAVRTRETTSNDGANNNNAGERGSIVLHSKNLGEESETSENGSELINNEKSESSGQAGQKSSESKARFEEAAGDDELLMDSAKSSATSGQENVEEDFSKEKPVLSSLATSSSLLSIQEDNGEEVVDSEQTRTRSRPATNTRMMSASIIPVRRTLGSFDRACSRFLVTTGNKQASIRQRLFVGSTVSSAAPPPTKLHELCADGLVTLVELERALEQEPKAVGITDDNGRLPLHILGDNDELVGTVTGKNIATAFAARLIAAHPDGMLALDSRGQMPFVSLISDWIFWVYKSQEHAQKAKKNSNVLTMNTILGGGRGRAVDNDDISDMFPAAKPASRATTKTTTPRAGTEQERMIDITKISSRLFPRVDLWSEVDWALSMLSMEMDELGGKNEILNPTQDRRGNFAHQEHHQKGDKRGELARHVISTIPALLKTILLLERDGGTVRKRLLKKSIIRRILLCHETVTGCDWITTMLHKQGAPSRRAVDFFVLVSETTVADYAGGFRTLLRDDVHAFKTARAQVYDAVESLDAIISSLVVLDTREVERAAATSVIWYTMDQRLEHPFVLGIVVIDLVLHVTLMLAVRNSVRLESPTNSMNSVVPTQVVVVICAHYMLRKVCEAISLFRVSISVFRNYYQNVWIILDFVGIILALTATLYNAANPNIYRNGLNAFVVGLLWLKVLAFLKVVNKQMSTFIYALLQILFDLRYFMLVLMVVIFGFGDMFHIAVSTKDNGNFCLNPDEPLEPPTEDFCAERLSTSYLRVYSMLIGDFELTELRDTSGITFLFVIFTLIGVVILLNVLIAVVGDSYEKATVSSSLLFGRARVSFCSQQEALEDFLKPENPFSLLHRQEGWVVSMGHLCRWLILLAIIGTALNADIFLITRSVDSIVAEEISLLRVIFSIILSITLTTALWVVLTFALGGLIRSKLSCRSLARLYDFVDKANSYVVSAISRWLFGLRDENSKVVVLSDNEAAPTEDWSGRVNYLEKRFEQLLALTEKNMANEMKVLLDERMGEKVVEVEVGGEERDGYRSE